MPDSTITTVRKALATQIQAGVARDINVKWYPMSDAPPPLIEVDEDPEAIDYLNEFSPTRGEWTLRFTLVIRHSAINAESLTLAMDDLLSPDSASSVYAAIAADRTLGGVAKQAIALSARRFQGEPAIAEIPVRITVAKP